MPSLRWNDVRYSVKLLHWERIFKQLGALPQSFVIDNGNRRRNERQYSSDRFTHRTYLVFITDAALGSCKHLALSVSQGHVMSIQLRGWQARSIGALEH